MTMAPGTDVLLGRRYRLVSRIAAGGMGEVWSATDQVLGRNVAVKVLRREYADDPAFRQRFRAEARHTAALSHVGIAAVYDYSDGSTDHGGDGESPFLVMENVPGEPLSDLIAREGTLTHDRALDVIGQAGFALQAAHDAGVIHRDVKPGNMLLTPDGTVKITDFGISRATNSVPLTATGAIMGTAFYLSPEQASGRPLTPATDVYSLGVVAYECLSGRRPFPGDTPVSVALAHVRDQPGAMSDGVRPEVAALVMRMLAKDPADRPSSASQLAREALDLRARLAQPLAATRTLPAAAIMAAEAVAPGGGAAEVIRKAARDDRTDPRFAMLAPDRRRRWVPYAVGLAVCALLLLLVGRSCMSATDTTSAATSTTSAPVTVLVRAADYVGKPVAEAGAAVRALGLTVSFRPVQAGRDTPIGTVTGVTPTGRLNPGETVTLDVAWAASGRDGKHGDHNGSGHDNKDDRKGG